MMHTVASSRGVSTRNQDLMQGVKGRDETLRARGGADVPVVVRALPPVGVPLDREYKEKRDERVGYEREKERKGGEERGRDGWRRKLRKRKREVERGRLMA